MLRRTPFARPVYVRPPPSPMRRLERPVSVWQATDDVAVTMPKENVRQHAGYMDLVRAMPCMHCGQAPRSQFCHSDQGKGMGIKTDCRRGWPGCARCHDFVGSTGALGRYERRLLEDEYAARTRAAIVAEGLWPGSLPMWEGACAS